MPELTLDLGADSYPIRIEPGLLDNPKLINQLLNDYCPTDGKTVVISNDKVWGLFGEKIKTVLAEADWCLIKVEDGEAAKSSTSYIKVIGEMLQRRCGRDGRILALGGGVIGDLSGFVGATYMRGISVVQIPTTLLAQVDSSVGGKTAINHQLAKNCIGAFKHPRLVLIDPRCLNHLDLRSVRAGLAEVIKYALIDNPSFCQWLEDHLEQLLERDDRALEYAIETSCLTKKAYVVDDPLDKSGKRAMLNFGHTFGHALEKVGHFNQWLHGEAVACGMLMAARLSHQLNMLSEEPCQRIERLINQAAGRQVDCSDSDPEQLFDAMRLDKKNVGGKIYLILLEDIGRARQIPIDDQLLKEFLSSASNKIPQSQ